MEVAERDAGRDDGGVKPSQAGPQAPSARVEAAIGRLRGAGERLTPGRRAVLEVLDEDSRHLDADAILEQVAVREPGVHRATVYRSLQALVDLQIVSHTHVPAGATIYHLTLPAGESDDAGDAPAAHAHLQCVRCEGFTDVDVAEFAPFAARIEETTGFVIDPGHGALLGVCAQCAASDEA